MGIDDVVTKIALRELADPSSSDLKRILEVHKLKEKNGRPAVVRMEYLEGNDVAHVHFSLQGEPYFLVVKVDLKKNSPIEYACIDIEPNYRVTLRISSHSMTLEEISKCILIQPTKTHTRCIYNREYNFWLYEPQHGIPGALENKLEFLLDRIENSKNGILKLLAENCEGIVSICFEGYKDWISGFGISNCTIKKIAEFGLELDFDMYVSGPDLPSID